jgi:hypothetical protein
MIGKTSILLAYGFSRLAFAAVAAVDAVDAIACQSK